MNVNDITKGVFLRLKEGIWQVTEFQHVSPGKGNSFVRTRLKNIKSGKALEHTFKSVETVEQVKIEITDAQYLYKSGSHFIFMDNSTYEQFELLADDVSGIKDYLTDGQSVMIMKLDSQPLSVTLPKKINLKVVEAPPGVKGDSSAGATKQVLLETGIHLSVPLFINEGDILSINTETGAYVERINQ